MEVYKFGGASVKDSGSLKNVVEIVKNKKSLVIVISAMGKSTNKLEEVVNDFIQNKDYSDSLNILKSEHESILKIIFPDKENEIWNTQNKIFNYLDLYLQNATETNYDEVYDQIVPVGELLSSKILSALLNLEGIPNIWVDARKVLRTDGTFRKANIFIEESNEIARKTFREGAVYVSQGFIGGTDNNLMTTLGREGSDYSAAILANFINASSVTVWKDVEGVLNADPRYFNEPKLLHHISYREAIELSFYGATIIHPKTIKPLQNKSVPLNVKCFLEPLDKGTLINSNTDNDADLPIYIYKPDQVLISLSRKDFGFLEEEQISQVFDLLHQHKTEVNIMQNSAINFFTFEECRYNIFSFFFLIFFSETITLAPFFIASLIKLFPSTLFPLIAKKILFFLTSEELKEIPEK